MKWFRLSKHCFYTDGYLEKWFNIWIENPLRTWWKARKYFKMPKIYFHFFFIPFIKPDFKYLNKKIKDRTYCNKYKESIEHFKQVLNKRSVHYYCPYIRYDYIGKIIDIKLTDVGWKDKYNSPRHESNPYIFICFFRFIGISIGFHVKLINEFGEKENGDMYYWEYLLNYLYYSKSLGLDSCWTYDSKIYRKRIFGENEEEDKFEPYTQIIQTPIFSLNKKGLKEFKKLYSNYVDSKR